MVDTHFTLTWQKPKSVFFYLILSVVLPILCFCEKQTSPVGFSVEIGMKFGCLRFVFWLRRAHMERE